MSVRTAPGLAARMKQGGEEEDSTMALLRRAAALRQRVRSYIAKGCPTCHRRATVSSAAQQVGVDPSAFHKWLAGKRNAMLTPNLDKIEQWLESRGA